MKRLAPVLLLLILSPLIAEYLLGSLSMGQIVFLPIMMLLYGGGAVLAREVARRAHRGWPTILILALAYGVMEEGLADQALFNPHFLGLRLLDYGFVPALGMGVPWTLDVLSLHVVWSIGAPIALVETLFPRRGLKPWLGKPGLAVFALLYAAGVALITFGTVQREHFMASPVQLGGAAIAIVLLIALAFLWPAQRQKVEGRAPNPWLVGVLAFAAGSAFELLYGQGANVFHWPWQPVAGCMLAIEAAMLLFGLIAGRRSGWSSRHVFAMAAGAVLVYGWLGFPTEITLHGLGMIWAHAVLAAAILGLLAFAGLHKTAAT